VKKLLVGDVKQYDRRMSSDESEVGGVAGAMWSGLRPELALSSRA
jgi:hypothetical protein